jgi:hypothetical protein
MDLEMEVVIVPHGDYHGMWVPKTFKRLKAIQEMIAGQERLRERGVEPINPLRLADEDQWAFVIGLLVCEQAMRVRL